MTFRVGQKVVCIDDHGLHGLRRVSLKMEACTLQAPVTGAVYTIREIDTSERAGLRLEEIINPVCMSILDGIAEPSFAQCRFRPVVERKTDISIFQKILDDASARVSA